MILSLEISYLQFKYCDKRRHENRATYGKEYSLEHREGGFPIRLTPIANGGDRTLKKNTHQRETTVSSNDSLQFRPFSKWELLLKERICSQRERILSFTSSSLRYGKLYYI